MTPQATDLTDAQLTELAAEICHGKRLNRGDVVSEIVYRNGHFEDFLPLTRIEHAWMLLETSTTDIDHSVLFMGAADAARAVTLAVLRAKGKIQ